jgi:hypothetical protein
MAHFAKIDENGVVEQVIVVDNMVLFDEANAQYDERLGAAFCNSLIPGKWVQTSYNGNIRKNFAGIGYTWDEGRDAFIPPRPYPSWVLNEEQCRWSSPIPYPESMPDGFYYSWNEELTNWELVEITEWPEPVLEPVLETSVQDVLFTESVQSLTTTEIPALSTNDVAFLSTTEIQNLTTAGL